MQLTDDDRALVKTAGDFITKHYKKDRHHVACALRCGAEEYLSLHLDTKGIDICAEPVAITNALIDGHADFDTIVAVLLDDQNRPRVVPPCGNCRQILLEYAPEARVIVPEENNTLRVVHAQSLLPFAYKK